MLPCMSQDALPHRLALTPPAVGFRLRWLAACGWWAVRQHVADLHGLPRGSAGPAPGRWRNGDL